jgi:hypothetical protein
MRLQLYGDGLDALIFSYEHILSGNSVTWYRTSEKPGGHFRGFEACGKNLDFGMVLLEDGTKNQEQLPIANADLRGSHDHLNFLTESFSRFESYFDGMTTIPVYTSFRDEEFKDFFISDSLDALSKLTAGEREVIIGELNEKVRWLEKDSSLHPKNKNSKEFDFKTSSLSLEEYYRLIYGEKLFQVLLFPLLSNATKNFTINLSPQSHRKVWAPIYWPETILAKLTLPVSNALDQFSFKYPPDQTIAQRVIDLESELSNHRGYKSHQVENFSGFLSVIMDDSSSYDKSVAFLNPREASLISGQKIGTTQFREVHVVHFCVDSELENSSIFFADVPEGIFRYNVRNSNQNEAHVTVEIFPTGITTPGDSILLASAFVKNRLGIIRCEGSVRSGRIPISSPEVDHDKIIEGLSHTSDYISVSFVNSLNDNTVRAYSMIAKMEGK